MTAPVDILGAIARGELVVRSPTAFERRDDVLRGLFAVGLPQASTTVQISDGLRRYARVAWLRERTLECCPARRIGTPEEFYWRVLRLVPRELSADRIERIVR